MRGFSVEKMEAGKARAMADRNRGYSVGKPAAGWVRVSHHTDEDGPTDQQRAHYAGTEAVAIAIEDFFRDMYPWRYEAFAIV